MRGFSTRNIRPCIEHSNLPSSTPLVRRTTLPLPQSTLPCADTFPTSALVITYTGRNTPRAEWSRQICAVQGEAHRRQQRQLASWARIQRRSLGHGACIQRRSLSTATAGEDVRAMNEDEESEQLMDPLGRMDEINAGEDNSADAEAKPDNTTGVNVDKQQRFSRLLATRLALELMLKLRQGRSRRYKLPVTVASNDNPLLESMDYILQELDKVTALISALKIHQVPWDIKMPDEFLQKQKELAARMSQLTSQYRDLKIHLPNYIISYVQLITEFKIGPPNSSYVEMFRALDCLQQESQMARIVEDAILDSHDYLDNYTVSNILYRHGIALDSSRFNSFLQRLTRADHHPRALSPWYRLYVNDIDICIPKTRNAHIITGLIRTALLCRQQTVAEAYATVFLDRDTIVNYDSMYKWFVIGNFLQSYGAWLSWKSGQKWLELAVRWASQLAEADINVLGRVVLRMLDFCVACGKEKDYEAVMYALVVARIPLPVVNPEKTIRISARMRAIRLDWDERWRAWDDDGSPASTNVEMARKFQSTLRLRWHVMNQPKEKASPDPRDDRPKPFKPYFKERQVSKTPTGQGLITDSPEFNEPIPPTSQTQSPEPEKPSTIPYEPHINTNTTHDPEDDPFTDPFFQPVSVDMNSGRLPASPTTFSFPSPSHPNANAQTLMTNAEIFELKEELRAAKQQIKELQALKDGDISKLTRDLEEVRIEMRALSGSVTPRRVKVLPKGETMPRTASGSS